MMTDAGRAEAAPPGEPAPGERRGTATSTTAAHSYVVPGDTLGFGASLGNAHCWLTTHGSGAIQDIFSTDIGAAIAGTVAVRYGGTGHHLLDS